MSQSNAVEQLASSFHRSILGALLALVGIVGIGLLRRTNFQFGTTENLLLGVVGIALAGGAVIWIGYLFVEGFREQ